MELFFPSFCLGCNNEGILLCGDCQATLDVSEYHYCLCNQKPLRLPKGGKCTRCRDKKLAGVYTALPYQEKALTRKLIHNFKYEPYLKSLAKPLIGIFAEHMAKSGLAKPEIWVNSVLMPIPMELSSQKRRGYNQAEELVRELSLLLTIPVENALVKTRKTENQMKLSAKERQENVKGVFAIKNPASITGKKIFLVDDVYTTGATMEECANVLRTFDRTCQVWGIAIAREG